LRAISNLLAVLLVLGIVVGLAGFVINVTMAQVSRAAEKPAHLQLLSRDVKRAGARAFRVELAFYNPTDKVFTVEVVNVRVYQSTSFKESSSYTAAPIVLRPGESGKLTFLVETSSTYQKGVLRIYVRFSTGLTDYQDTIPIPFS